MNVNKGGVTMKKYLFLMLVVFVTLLSACAAQMDPDEDYDPSDKEYGSSLTTYMVFQWGSLTYAPSNPSDILYGYTSPEYDYLYVISEEESFTEQKYDAYQSTFIKLVELDYRVGTFSLINLDQYTTDDIKELAEANDLEISAYDIFTVNAIQDDFTNYQLTNYYSRISKIEYIEQRLDTELSEEEIASLIYLQDVMNDLIYANEEIMFYNITTFEQLLNHLERDISMVPNIDEKLLLEQAFNIMQQMK